MGEGKLSADRHAGAQTAWVGAGGSGTVQEYVVPEMTTAAGEKVGLAMARTHVPRGVLCTNDQLAIGVIRGLTDSGVDVPTTTAVVGYGNLAIAADAPVPLTTVDQPEYALGQVAVELLLSEMDLPQRRHAHSATVFQPTMILRNCAMTTQTLPDDLDPPTWSPDQTDSPELWATLELPLPTGPEPLESIT